MTWAMAELARETKLMKKAQEEVRRCIGKKGKISERDTDEIQYIKMIIKETRLHPPAPMIISREIMSHFKIQGYDLAPKHLSLSMAGQLCPGMYMVITTLKLGLANLLYWFDWKLPNGMKEEDIDMEENRVYHVYFW
ncbi:unnamed protein product [Prunus armeniaca]